MDLICPQCGASDVRRVSLVYREGTTTVEEQSGGVGVGAARGGLGVGVFGAKTQGVHKTLLARDLAPPQALKLSGWAALGAVVGLGYYIAGLSAAGGGGVIVGVLLLIPCARYLWRQNEWNSNELPKLVKRWEDSYHCSRCGTVFVPGQAGASQEPAPRPSFLELSRGALIAIGVTTLAGVAIGAVRGSSESSSAPAANVPAKRQADSVSAIQLLSSLRVPETRTTANLLRFEALVHGSQLAISHDPLHVRAVSRRLDSADVLLRPNRDGWGKVTPAREQVNAIYAPLTPAQQQRKAQLLRKAQRQDSLIQIASRRAAEQLMVRQRREFGKRAESLFLDQGMDVEVTIRGSSATTLHMKYVLANRVMAHQLSQNGDFFQTLRNMGFRRLELTDGYDYSVYWDLR